MTTPLKCAIGLDVSKNKFDACLAVMDASQTVKIKSSKSSLGNTAKGFDEFLCWVEKHTDPTVPTLFCLEATGIYYEQLAWYLHQKGMSVSVVLPSKAHHYIRSLGFKSKNDIIDARALAIMAVQQQLKLWVPFSDQLYELRQLTRFYQQLQESRTIFQNQLHAYECSHLKNTQVERQIKEMVAVIDSKITDLSEAIERTLKEDPQLWQKVNHMLTVKGLGLLSIATVIAETDGFALFENIAQLVSYSGYDVVQNQSGNHNGKTRISKKGNSRIRRILFMPAFNVVKFRVAPFANLYERIYERTRLKMKGYTAVQRKLLILIFTLWKREENFDPAKYPEMTARSLSFR